MTRRPRNAVGVAALVIATVATMTLAVFTSGATSAPSDDSRDTGGVPAEMFQALQRDLGLSARQVRDRLANEDRLRPVEQRLRRQLGTAFAGAWFSPDASALTVAVTDGGKARTVRAAGARPLVVKRSAADLDALVTRLDRHLAQAPATVHGWGVDVITNTVSIATVPTALAAAQRFAAAVGLDPAAVTYTASRTAPRPLIDIIGGNAYTFGSGRCSVGFAVTTGFVTAGHCGTQGTRTSNPSGVVAGSVFPGRDMGYVRTDPGNTPRPLVNNYRGGTAPVAGKTEAPVNAQVCRSGSTTGWRCGVIQAKNQTVNYPQGSVSGLTRTSACAEPGDSGGSWLSDDQAQGVTSGGSGNCTSGGTFFFQPLNPILSTFSVQLVTTGTTPTSSPTTSPTSTPTTPPGDGCKGVPAWSATGAYEPGDQVSHNSHGWEATWWSTGAEPGAAGSWGVWRDLGAC